METGQNNVIGWNTPTHPKFNLFNQRLESFINEGWPIGLAQKPKTLAEAGFFYDGRGDIVFCYYCGGGVCQWSKEDDVWVEHAKHYPNCAYLVLIKSRSFIHNVQKNAKERTLEQQKTNRVSSSFPRSCLNLDKENLLSTKKNMSLLKKIVKACKRSKKAGKQENGLQDERNCKLCTLEEAIIVFVPCGHLLVCKYCAASLTDCPICRVKIDEFVKVYFS